MDKQNDLVKRAKKFRHDAQGYWQHIYTQGLQDKEFVTVEGAQWSHRDKVQREEAGKPTLEINLVRSYVRQQINTMRQNRPQAKVVPVGDGADVEMAKILGGLIKDVEEASNFEDALDTAAENAVYGGIGYYRIVTDYVDEQSFNQEPRFMPIVNPQAVYIDPLSKALDGSDMTKALIVEWVHKDAIEQQYGADAITDFKDDNADWYNSTDNSLCVAEYFSKEQVNDKLVLLRDGQTAYLSDLLKEHDETEIKAQTVSQRTTTKTVIKWAKLTGDKVLEQGEFPGKYIPIFPVYGEVTWVENQRHVFSLVHFAKDAQRLFNYWKSTEAHILQKNQDEMTIVDDRGIAGFEEWNNPSSAMYLRFRATDENSQPIQPPFKLGAANPPVGILNAATSAQQLIPDILNMHAPQMGAEVNGQSGRAIGLLQRQADTAQFHFQDNVNKTIRHSARVLLGLFPILYDTQMVRRIVGADGQTELVRLNAKPQTPDEASKAIDGILNNMSVGRFDVRMDTGPSFNTQREESFNLMMQLVQSNPSLFNVVADLMIRNSPLINANEIAERVKMLVPPQALGQDKIDPEQAKAQIQQLDQVVQQQQADLQNMAQQLNDKQADRELELHKILLQAEKDVQVAQINAASRADVQELRGVVDLIKQQIGFQNAPPNWLQQGEGVNNYAPKNNDFDPDADHDNELMTHTEQLEPNANEQEFSQSGGEPPPDDAQHEQIENPADEQGFLMPQANETDPEPDHFGQSHFMVNEDLNDAGQQFDD